MVGNYPCLDSYSEADEDQDLYCIQWKPYDNSKCGNELNTRTLYTADSWKYIDAHEIWGISRMGEYNTYSGGGYILKFVKNRESAFFMLGELFKYDWIDRKTRAVFLEFTLYNPNVNIFIYATLLVEFSEIGGAFTMTDTQAFKPVLSLSSLGFGLVVAFMIFLFYNIFLLFKIIWNCKVFGCLRYIREPWNFVDCISTFLAYSCIVIFVLRMKYTNTAMDMFYDDKVTDANRFINFGHIVIWDNVFNVVFAILVFISTIQILKILGYNKMFTGVLSVISKAGHDLIAFGFLLLILLIAFAFLAFLLFGSNLESYRNLYVTCGSLANTFIGKNKLDPLIVASPLTAQFFYMVYVVVVIMFMLTIFLSILNNSISAVKAEIANSSNSVGMVDIIRKSFRNFLEIFYRPEKIEEKTGKLNDAIISI